MTLLDERPSAAAPPTAVSTTTPAPPPAPTSAPVGMQRLRIALLTLLGVVGGGSASAVFDDWRWSLALAPLVPGAVAMVTAGRGPVWRLTGAVAAVIGTVALVAVAEGGGLGDVPVAFGAGVRRVLSTEWPSPLRADLVATVAAVVVVATAVAAELAMRRRWHLLPLLPLLVALVAVVGASANTGFRPGWWFAAALLAMAFATLRPDDRIDDRLAVLRGERSVVVLIAVALGLAAIVSIPVSFLTRADPRDDDPPSRTSPLLDPIEATLALRDLDPPVVLHVVTADSGTVLPARWRTAALDSYDGQRWTPTLALQPIGRTLGVDGGSALTAGVSFLDASLRLVPLPGDPVSVDADVETDPGRTVVRLVDPVEPPATVPIVSNLAPTRAEAIETGLASREIDDESSAFTELAERLGGDAPVVEQLFAIESTMRDEFVLDSDVQGGGLQRALVERFLRETRRGTEEQFATGFALLARSLGVDARVATGFAADASAASRLELSSRTASVWPEVRLADGRWLALDPAPDDEASDASPPPQEPETQAPVAPQPPIAPPPESEGDTGDDDQAETDDDADAFSTAVSLVLRAVAVGGALLLPVLVVAGAILGAKWWRRRRRRRAFDPRERIRGAWASATDDLVDVGLTIAPSATDHEIARAGRPLVGDAQLELDRLARLSSVATFGEPTRPDSLADDATGYLSDIERSIDSAAGRWGRLRWRLSVRSLRRSTRSPVDV